MMWKVEIFKPQVCISNRSRDMASQSFDFFKILKKNGCNFWTASRSWFLLTDLESACQNLYNYMCNTSKFEKKFFCWKSTFFEGIPLEKISIFSKNFFFEFRSIIHVIIYILICWFQICRQKSNPTTRSKVTTIFLQNS